MAEAAVDVLPGIDEIAERAAMGEVVGMRRPGLRRQRRLGEFQAGLADEAWMLSGVARGTTPTKWVNRRSGPISHSQSEEAAAMSRRRSWA